MPAAPMPNGSRLCSLPLTDFTSLQNRYNNLPLRKRASTVLEDAQTALSIADDILNELRQNPETPRYLDKLRGNHALVARLRPCEAKAALLDAGSDFIEATRRKLRIWQKTMERVGAGEDMVAEGKDEYIPGTAPLAIAVSGIGGIAHFLSIVQLCLSEIDKAAPNGNSCRSQIAEIRRCATVLSDCEHAAGLERFIH